MGGRSDGWTDGRTDGRTEGRTDGRTFFRRTHLKEFSFLSGYQNSKLIFVPEAICYGLFQPIVPYDDFTWLNFG